MQNESLPAARLLGSGDRMTKKFTKSVPWQANLAIGFIKVCSRLPLSVVRAFGAFLAHLSMLVPNRHVSVSRSNIERCLPDLPHGARSRIVRMSLVSTAKTVAEMGAMWNWPEEKLGRLAMEVENEHLLHEAMAAQKGVLLLVPHIGNWEFMNAFLVARYPVLALYRPPKLVELEEYFRRGRQRSGATMVPSDHGGLKMLLRGLRAGQLVAILPDQEPLKSNGVFAPFFGVEALTITLVASLLRRLPAQPLFAFAERCPGGFNVRFLEAPRGLDHADDRVAAERLNLGVERCVRKCPDQYIWSYKRFRTRPESERWGRDHG